MFLGPQWERLSWVLIRGQKKQVKESRVCHNQSQHTQLICPCHLFHASLLEPLSAPNVRKHCVPSRDEFLPLCVCSLAGLRASTHAISFLEGLFSTPSGPSFSHIQTLSLKKNYVSHAHNFRFCWINYLSGRMFPVEEMVGIPLLGILNLRYVSHLLILGSSWQ